MLKSQVKVGSFYAIRHHNERQNCVVQVLGESLYGGYSCKKLKTNRTIHVKSAGKFRYEVKKNYERRVWERVYATPKATKISKTAGIPTIGPAIKAEIILPKGYGARQNEQKKFHLLIPKEQELSECDGCNGNGIYYGRGSVVNGVFKGFTNTCFRCGGKGKQNESDRKRNYGYDQNRKFAVA